MSFAAAGLLLLASVASASAGERAQFDLQYDAYVLGFPAVTLAFRLEDGESAYHVAGAIHTNGIADMVVTYRLTTRTDGRVVGGKLQPTEQATLSKRNGVERRTRLDYQGGAVHAELVPAPEKTLPAEQTAGTLDPTSAALTASRVLAASGRCEQRIKVFDGRRRYDLVLTDDGDETLARGLGVYSGPAHRCEVRIIRIDEVQHEEVEAKNAPAYVWFGKIDPALPPLPVRLEFTSRWGSAILALTSVAPVGAAEAKR